MDPQLLSRTGARRHSAFRRWAIRAALVAFGVLVLCMVGWRLQGGNWLIVSTPSMGRAAPVGTLVLIDKPAPGTVRVGDIVSYVSPAGNGTVYTHRVIWIDATGGLHLRGDANAGADPWTLRESDLSGVVVARLWGLGWLVRALPILLGGGLLLWFGTTYCRSRHWRWAIRIVGSSLLFAVAAVVLRPFVKIIGIDNSTDAAGVHLQVISAGLFPVRVSASTGGFVDLVDGQTGTILTRSADAANSIRMTATLHLSFWQWVLLVLFWLLPVWWALYIDRTSGPDGPAPEGGAGAAATADRLIRPRRQHFWTRRTTVAIALAAVAMTASTAAGTSSAFTATVTNTADTATTATWFTCQAAAVGSGAYYAYPLGDWTSGGPAADVSGNNRTGTWNGTATASSTPGCVRDTTGSVTATAAGQVSVATPNQFTNPQTFSLEIWFRSTTAAGRLIGFGSARTGTSTSYDRTIYLNSLGQVVFGITTTVIIINSQVLVTSPGSYTDGAWHQVVVTFSPTAMLLYVDGAQVASNVTGTAAQNYSGYWRVGYDTMSGWTGATAGYTGSLASASVYTSVLTATQVQQHYIAGR